MPNGTARRSSGPGERRPAHDAGDRHDDDRHGKAEYLALTEPDERRSPVDADGPLPGERQRETPDAEQPRQGHDKEGHFGLGDQEPVAETDQPAQQGRQDEGERPENLHGLRGDHTTQGQYRPNRQVDAPAYDHEGHPYHDQAKKRPLKDDVLKVLRGKEVVERQGGDGDDQYKDGDGPASLE